MVFNYLLAAAPLLAEEEGVSLREGLDASSRPPKQSEYMQRALLLMAIGLCNNEGANCIRPLLKNIYKGAYAIRPYMIDSRLVPNGALFFAFIQIASSSKWTPRNDRKWIYSINRLIAIIIPPQNIMVIIIYMAFRK